MMQSLICVSFGVECGSKDLVMHFRGAAHDILLRGCNAGRCSHLSRYDSETIRIPDTTSPGVIYMGL